MFPKDLAHICVFYCLSPLHAGSGQATGAVDLPIQRERHTGWPQVQASGVKGAFRDWFLRFYLANGAQCDDRQLQAEELTQRVFGREEVAGNGKEPGGEQEVATPQAGGQAGAISVTDARLLAFPVRSDAAPFVWVSCPAVMTRLARDLALCPEAELKIPIFSPAEEYGYISVIGNLPEKMILEDMAVSNEDQTDSPGELATAFRKLAPNVTRLAVISDKNFSFLVSTATEIQPQIKIDFDSGTTADGSLRYEELLPSDSVLYSLVFFSSERNEKEPLAVEVISGCVKKAISTHIRMGGDMTLGRGIMEVRWFSDSAGAGGAQ